MKKDYILGTDQDELDRLGFQHRVWSEDAFSLWKRGGVRMGLNVLDLGSGPGFATFDLATIVGASGSVTAVDISQAYVDYGNHQASVRGVQNVEFLQRSIHDLGLEHEKYDVIYCRWVLSWVDSVDKIIEEISKLLKPGGVFLVQEYAQWGTFRIEPERVEVRTMIEACRESWRVMPSEIDIAPHLPAMFNQFGLKLEFKSTIEKVSSPGEMVWQWPTTFLHIYSHKLIEMGLMTTAERDAFVTCWPEMEATPNAMIITPLMMEFVARKP
jgi:ubiquinone/menaquinone biosynthesis C-methylase UbiE